MLTFNLSPPHHSMNQRSITDYANIDVRDIDHTTPTPPTASTLREAHARGLLYNYYDSY